MKKSKRIEPKICCLCAHYSTIHKLSSDKNAMGCEMGFWKITAEKFKKDLFDNCMDEALKCDYFEKKKPNIIKRRKR